ncbi:MAG: 2-phospho-L-lactate transferase [Propionibacteriaceae bacterium]
MRIVILAGGVGGSRFTRGALAAFPDADVTVVVNTADDITLHGLRICPDLDTVMYALGGGIDAERGWGRADESWSVREELAGYGVEPAWFGLGDRDIATHLVRTQSLEAGYPLSEVTTALCRRWLADLPLVRLVPMSDERVETPVVINDPTSPSGRRALHFQEYWVRLRAEPDALDVVQVGIADAKPAPGVVEALGDADLIMVAPSNPVVSVGPILAVPGLRAAVQRATAPVVGFSPVIGRAPVLGMAHRLLPAIGVEVSAEAVGRHYGVRSAGGILDGWLVHSTDADAATRLSDQGLPSSATDLIMSSAEATAAFVRTGAELVSRS